MSENANDNEDNQEKDKILERDEFVLSMMIHAYEEDERRTHGIDNKISSMIAVIGVIFTVQSSLLTSAL